MRIPARIGRLRVKDAVVGEHLKRKVAVCGSRHAAAGEEQAMPAARQPPQTASNELTPPPLPLPQPRKVADGAAVMPQRAHQETLATPASTPAAPSAIDELTPASLPLRRPACGSKVTKQTLRKIKARTPGRAQQPLALMNPLPTSREAWLNEIGRAFRDASDAIPFAPRNQLNRI